MDQFDLEGRPQVFGEGIVEAIPDAAGGRRDAGVDESLGEPHRGVLTGLVAVVDQLPVADVARPDRVVEHRNDQLGGRTRAAVPADHLVGERVSHAGQPQDTSPVRIRVRSATHLRLGAVAVKSRPSRSGAAVCLGFCRVDPCFQPWRR